MIGDVYDVGISHLTNGEGPTAEQRSTEIDAFAATQSEPGGILSRYVPDFGKGEADYAQCW